MKEVLTVIPDKKLTREQINGLPFLQGLDIWNLDEGRTGEVIERIKQAGDKHHIKGSQVRPSFFRKNKGVLYKEERPSSNYYTMPEGSDSIVVFRVNKVGAEEDYEISKENMLRIEVVNVLMKEKK